MDPRGLFVGLTTLDLIYLAAQPPAANQKQVAQDYTVSAGGPATNAAVAFRHLGGAARLLSAIGSHPLAQLITADLQECGVQWQDLLPDRADSPPVSSIIVTAATGDRAVISINAARTPVDAAAVPPDCLKEMDVVLIDGHQMAVGHAIARQAKAASIPVVIDAGSWKPGFETVLPLVDYVICSANFLPPGCRDSTEVAAFLTNLGVPYIAITHGSDPIEYWQHSQREKISVPAIAAVDTLGAGDIFHGAFCYRIVQEDFRDALAGAATVAAHACRFFGTRRWLTQPLDFS